MSSGGSNRAARAQATADAQAKKLAKDQLAFAKEQFAEFAPTIANVTGFFNEFDLTDIQQGNAIPRSLQAIQRDVGESTVGAIQRVQRNVREAGGDVSQAALASLPELQSSTGRLLQAAGEQTRRGALENRLRIAQLGQTGQLQASEAARGSLSTLSTLGDVAGAERARQAAVAGNQARGFGELLGTFRGRQGVV